MSEVYNRFNKLKSILLELENPQDKLEYFVELANLYSLSNQEQMECFLVRGCISRLWLVPEFNLNRCYFRCDGDAIIPKGVARALLSIFSDATPEDILSFDKSCLNELGLTALLGANRRNAVANLVGVIQSFAASVSLEHAPVNVAAIKAFNSSAVPTNI